MAKKKWYVVWKGYKPGIYTSWSECEKQVKGFPGARFKSYSSENEALHAWRGDQNVTKGQNSTKTTKQTKLTSGSTKKVSYIEDSISVDAGSHGNPGPIQYKGVYTKTGETVFSNEDIPLGTNNIGEFLAIVHALAMLKRQGSKIPVYSDSETAMKWVKRKKVKTTLPRKENTKVMWELVDRAEKWLRENHWDNPLLKWNTEAWGEIKADYGRK